MPSDSETSAARAHTQEPDVVLVFLGMLLSILARASLGLGQQYGWHHEAEESHPSARSRGSPDQFCRKRAANYPKPPQRRCKVICS